MMWSSRFARRAAAVAVTAATAALLMAGCSSMGPESATELGTGDVSGRITTPVGMSVPGVQVTLWADFETAEYAAQTDGTGTYIVADLGMSTRHAYSEVYEIYVNRTRASSTPIDNAYGTYSGQVVVAKDQTVSCNVTIARLEPGPSNPEQIVEVD